MITQELSRPRPDPSERFAAPEHCINLLTIKSKLLTEPIPAEHGHRQETIYKTRTLTIATFVFAKDASLPEHVTTGVVMIQVIDGRISVTTHSRTYEMTPGEVLVLGPKVQHTVTANEQSQMLLTVDLSDPVALPF